MRMRALLLAAAVALGGCEEMTHVAKSLTADTQSEETYMRGEYNRQKTELEALAAKKQLTWVEAARRVRGLDQQFGGRGTWVYDSNSDEYHAYSIALAQQVDAGQMTFEQYDALRTAKYNEIQRRRAK
jgi:hypothetical protein